MNKYAGSLKTQCRSCLEIAPFLYPLEGLPANCDVSISTMISYCTGTEVDLSESLPRGVCVQCFRTVRIAYNFIRQYRDSQIKLLEENHAIGRNQNESEAENDENNSNIENDTASEGEEKNGDHESQNSNLENETASEEEEKNGDHESQDSAEEQQMSDAKNDCFDESANYMEQDEGSKLGTVEIEYKLEQPEYDTHDSDLLEQLEKLESGLYELDNSTDKNNYQVRVVRQDTPPNSHESTIFRMKVNTRHTCPLCPKVCFRHFERGLMRHMEVHEGETFPCTSCTESQTEYNIDTFLKHYADIHLYQCHFCQKSFAKRCSLLYHVKTHTNIIYTCKQEDCRKVCPSQAALIKHESTHSNFVKHICSECGKNFRTYDTYRYHMHRHKGNKFLCSICGRTFILSVNLKNHMLAHKGGRPFKCSFCDRTYTSYTPLNKHMRRIHADKKLKNSRYYQYDKDT